MTNEELTAFVEGNCPHNLVGNRQNICSLAVSGGWRITLKFMNGDAYITNYEDYHQCQKCLTHRTPGALLSQPWRVLV